MADERESTTWSFGGSRRSRPFSGQMGRRKRWNQPGFRFIWGQRPFCGGLKAWYGRRWEIGGERGSRRREERDALGYATVRTLERCTGAAEACDPLDLWWKDRAAVIGLTAGWSDGPDVRRFDRVWHGIPKARYTGWRGATGSNLGIFQGLRCVGIYLVFFKLFFLKQYPTLVKKN